MIKEFEDVLSSPKQSPTKILNKMQNLVLNSMEQYLPSSFDYSYLSVIYQEQLGSQKAQKLNLGETIALTIQQQISLNYKIIQYFISSVKQFFVNIDIYQGLEEQTQKAESTIRSHIKIEQEMKMYLEYLQAKIHRYEKEFQTLGPNTSSIKKQMEILRNKEEILYKQKVNLIKKNQELSYELQNLNLKIKCDNDKTAEKIIQNETGDFLSLMYGTKLSPEEARQCESKFNSNQSSPYTKEKEKQGFVYQTNEYDLTQKKRSTYFPGLK